jgi:hypothetical protein
VHCCSYHTCPKEEDEDEDDDDDDEDEMLLPSPQQAKRSVRESQLKSSEPH